MKIKTLILVIFYLQISALCNAQSLSNTVRQDFCKNAIENYYYGTGTFSNLMNISAKRIGLDTPLKINNAVQNLCSNIKLQNEVFKNMHELSRGLFEAEQYMSIGMRRDNAIKLVEYYTAIDGIKKRKELELSKINVQNEKKKEGIPNKTKQNIIRNGFDIPIKSDTEETKPKIYDKNLEHIVFQSSAVVWKKPNEGTSVDKSEWTLTLTSKDFVMKSMNYEKKFKIINVKYDEDFQMQKFELADETTAHTFNLLISYTLETTSYNIMVQSINYKEEYQFQGVVGKEKIFQK